MPKHDFYLTKIKDFNLVNLHEISYELNSMNNTENIRVIDKVRLDDDLYTYLYDTLKWIPSKLISDPSNIKISKGFDRYGISLLDKSSSTIMKNIFSGWINIFNEAPNIVELKGDYEFIVGSEDEGHYEYLKIPKTELLEILNKFKNFAIQLEKENYYIFHCGI